MTAYTSLHQPNPNLNDAGPIVHRPIGGGSVIHPTRQAMFSRFSVNDGEGRRSASVSEVHCVLASP